MTSPLDSATGVVQLTIVTGDQAGRNVEVDGSELVIGRATDTNVTIHDANVSRRHASITPLGDGKRKRALPRRRRTEDGNRLHSVLAKT